MGKDKILVVDDNKDMRESVKEILEFLLPDKEIISAADGIEGWEVIQKKFNSLYLIITDWEMPGLNGIELTKKIKAAFPEIPVILTSANSPPKNNQSDGFLGKPFYINDLATLIQNVTS